jgi:hypothetical protein
MYLLQKFNYQNPFLCHMYQKRNISNFCINIFKGAYEQPENMYQRTKQEKLRRIIYKSPFKKRRLK